MRDLFVSCVVFGSLPLILKRPWIGILMWCWLSYMNPHRLSWGFAYNFPFAMLVALATLAGAMLSKEPKPVPWTRETKVLAIFVAWMVITTFFAWYPDDAKGMLDRVLKIQLMTFVTLMLINTRERLHTMVWIIALSLGFFGVKGGIFTLAHGGVYRVSGPDQSFISGNNELALALVMVIPLMRYLQLNTSQRWLRFGIGGAILLSAIAALGSQSRGALLALSVMGLFLWMKSRKKLATALIAASVVAGALAILPPQYYERMNTIKTYEQDQSAMGRINAWWVAFNIAKDRPLVAGGFQTFQRRVFQIYAPNPDDSRDVHSIYFQVLGEHGFVGLALFLTLGFMTWSTANRVRRTAYCKPEQKWLADLMAMSQVSLVGYAVGGAFLGLAYFDLPYHVIAIVVLGARMQDLRGASVPIRAQIGANVKEAG